MFKVYKKVKRHLITNTSCNFQDNGSTICEIRIYG
jgi:hypothetical protein